MNWTTENRRQIVDRRYRKTRALKLLRGEPTSLVDAAPAQARVSALVDAGWSFAALEQMIGGKVTDVTLNNVASGFHPTITRQTAAAVLSLPLTLAPNEAVDPSAFVPTLGGQRRIHALLRLGWPHSILRPQAGTDTTHLARGSYQHMMARRWRQIADLYEQLSMTPGPSHVTAARARASGYAPPLAWGENIDSLTARPVGHSRHTGVDGDIDDVVVARLLAGERVASSRAEKVEATRQWIAQGKSIRSLCLMHGWNDNRYAPREDGAA